ncbi:MAG: hypothetical protein LQ343_005637, partial [Gyalolechia ehrenbergii]
IWRPIGEAVQDDARTLNSDDLVEADYIFPHYHGEKFLGKHTESHKWYYMKNQDVDEVALLKISDSQADFAFDMLLSVRPRGQTLYVPQREH